MAEEQTDWSTLVPGEEVSVEGLKMPIRVYPFGVQHFQKYGQEIAGLIGIAARAAQKASQGGFTEANFEMGVAAITEAIPRLTSKTIDMISECCSPSLKGAPAWVLPKVLPAWARQSFGGSHWNPLTAAIENAMEKALGTKISLSELASIAWSRLGTLSKEYSEQNKKDSTASPSLIEDGPGDSLHTGSE